MPSTSPPACPAKQAGIDFWTDKLDARRAAPSLPTAPLEHHPPLCSRRLHPPPRPSPCQFTSHEDPCNAPLELRVYTGADAHFTLYEDDGVTATRTNAASSRSRSIFTGRESSQRLTLLHTREGTFPEMLTTTARSTSSSAQPPSDPTTTKPTPSPSSESQSLRKSSAAPLPRKPAHATPES